MSKKIRLLSAAVLCAIVAACASMGKATPVNPDEQTSLVVDNRQMLDMNIYIIRSGGQRIRLGTAQGLSRTKLIIPRGIVLGSTTVRFLADPIGGSRSPVSEEISVNPGDEVSLSIPPF